MILTLQKLLQKAKQVSDPRDAHALALDLVESMLRHYAVVAIAAYRHAGAKDSKLNRMLSEQLPRPSMGSWKNFLQVLAHADPHLFPEQFWDKFLQPLTKKISNPDISAAYAILKKLADQDVFASHEASPESEPVPCTPLEFLDATVAYRNRFAGHGTHELPDSALKFAPIFLRRTTALCTHLNTLWLACPVYVAKQAKLYGRTFFRLISLVEAEGIGEIQATVPGMEEDRLYICFGDRKHPEVESLYPAALWEEDDILFANGTKGLIDIHYIGYASQRCFETSIYEEDYRTFLEPFTSPEKTTKLNSITPPSIPPISEKKRTPRLMIVLLSTVLCVLVLVAGFVVYSHYKVQEIKSIAVLPFEDMSRAKDQDYFCESIADEIRNTLMNVSNLHVIGPRSSSQFKGKNISYSEIGRQLNVEAILDGRVRKEGDNLLIYTNLIKTADQTQLFSLPFNKKTSETFNIPEEIALSIVNRLRVKVSNTEQATMEQRSTKNFEAFDAYAQGINSLKTNAYGKETLNYFNKSIRFDKNFALAYAGIANVYNWWGQAELIPPKEAYPLAKENANTALSLNKDLAEAYTQLAWTNLYYDWDMEEAKKNLDHAFSLKPSDPVIHFYYREYYMILGRWDEAIVAIRRARTIEPTNILYTVHLALNLSQSGQHEEALKEAKKAVQMEPKNFWPWCTLAGCYYYAGQYNEALNILPKIEELGDPWNNVPFYRAQNLKKLGRRDEARHIFEEIIAKKRMTSYPLYMAEIYMNLDNFNKTFEYLEEAFDHRTSNLVFIKSFPEWKPIRSDSRYKPLLKKMGLPE
jgi:TolB-like protein